MGWSGVATGYPLVVLMSMYKSAVNQVEICLGMFTNIVKLQNWKKPLLMKFS
jgi:hypothetical protein